MYRRFFAVIGLISLSLQSTSALASDWIEDEISTAGSVFRVPGTSEPKSLSPFSTQMQLQEAAKSNAPRLHFAQALDALDIEILAKKNSSDNVTARLDSLEKAVFGAVSLPELNDNMARLVRLTSVVRISEQTLGKIAYVNSLGSKQSHHRIDSNRQGVLSRSLRSPTFWILVAATGAIIGAYFLSKSSSPTPVSGFVNPNQYYVGPYLRNGKMVSGGWRTSPNGVKSDNLSGR